MSPPAELPAPPRCQRELPAEQRVLPSARAERLERRFLPTLIPEADVRRLLWIPGTGKVAALTPHLEADGVARFPDVRAFSHAAVRAIQYCPEVQAWYRLRTKGAMIARALVAEELARTVYHVLAKRQDFNGAFKGAPLPRTKQLQWPRTPSPAA